MRHFTTTVLILVLVSLSLSLFLYKSRGLEFPLTPDKQYHSWYVEMRLKFRPDYSLKSDMEEPTDKPVRFEMYLPREQRDLAIVEEQIVANGYGRDFEDKEDGNRSVIFTKRKTDRKELLYYRMALYQIDSPEPVEGRNVKRPVAESPYNIKRHPAIAGKTKEDPMLMALESLILEAKETSADKKSLIQSLTRAALKADDRHRLIMTSAPEAPTPMALAVLLLNTANIPARLVHGIDLEDPKNQGSFKEWPEVWYKDRWRPINPETQDLFLRRPHLRWWIGLEPPYRLDGGHAADMKISVKKNTDSAMTRAIWKSGKQADFLLRFSLFNLPVSAQLLFQVLLMIPVGGLVIAFMRQVVGVKTFGTFMPVLVALAFRETGLTTGIVAFCLIVTCGLIIRSWFHKLQLLMVPRLAAVLTIVVLLIGWLALMAQNLGIDIGLSISLFPIVILTMTIERMSTMWDESGPREAVQVGVGSMICAVISYYVMTQPLLVHLVFTFPELLLIVLAGCILLGRYNGYKVTEYRRFRKLYQQIEAQK